MARGAALPAAQTAQQLAQMQMQMGMGLGQQFLGQRGQQYQAQTGLLGSILGGLGQMGAPEYWQPTYNIEDSDWDKFMGGLSDIADIGGGIAGLFAGGMA